MRAGNGGTGREASLFIVIIIYPSSLWQPIAQSSRNFFFFQTTGRLRRTHLSFPGINQQQQKKYTFPSIHPSSVCEIPVKGMLQPWWALKSKSRNRLPQSGPPGRQLEDQQCRKCERKKSHPSTLPPFHPSTPDHFFSSRKGGYARGWVPRTTDLLWNEPNEWRR